MQLQTEEWLWRLWNNAFTYCAVTTLIVATLVVIIAGTVTTYRACKEDSK